MIQIIILRQEISKPTNQPTSQNVTYIDLLT
jgi:hypothetical protein